ncbi:unnamed protein product [Didymodactylos carnosus]|uniref:RRM domain-containing protein n=1 Tax=Didymodactylos carnosus TaxID=1234261 RepID=A0A814K0J9_9BILA|nr:unnamed protein product [Didymodactylos carnosus]CAF1044650.1 unnamed protein product [Didymodactylos carnosus]CAF3701842.1 unnamed protein product [Didymodactylos carnosus]CAF3814623.1 unnamed protein product [Didymodactylos carnosus]
MNINQFYQQPAKPQKMKLQDIDARRLILFNLPTDIIREYLELYIENLTNEAEIERIDYSNECDTTVMVTFKQELGLIRMIFFIYSYSVTCLFVHLDLQEAKRRHSTRPKLNNNEISISDVYIPSTIMIRNLPDDISKDVLELYFSNKKRSDGGEVKEVKLDQENQHALVTFKDSKGTSYQTFSFF